MRGQYVLPVTLLQTCLFSRAWGAASCFNSVSNSSDGSQTTNFTCTYFCCVSSDNSYKYCCSDCTLSYYTNACVSISPWVIAGIVFLCVIVIGVVVPIAVIKLTINQRRTGTSSTTRSSSGVSDLASPLSNFPPPPPAYSAYKAPSESVSTERSITSSNSTDRTDLSTTAGSDTGTVTGSASSSSSASTESRQATRIMRGVPPPAYTEPSIAFRQQMAPSDLTESQTANVNEQPVSEPESTISNVVRVNAADESSQAHYIDDSDKSADI